MAGGLQAVESRFVETVFAELLLQIFENRFVFEQFSGDVVLNDRLSGSVVNPAGFEVVFDNFVGKTAVADGFFAGTKGFNGKRKTENAQYQHGQNQIKVIFRVYHKQDYRRGEGDKRIGKLQQTLLQQFIGPVGF